MSGRSRGNQKLFRIGFTGYDKQGPFAVHRMLRPHHEERAPKQQGHCITVSAKPSRLGVWAVEILDSEVALSP